MLSTFMMYLNAFQEDSCVFSDEEKLSTYYLDPWKSVSLT